MYFGFFVCYVKPSVLSNNSAIFTAYDDFVHFDISEPERNLMRAILRSAIEDYQKGGEAHKEARRFILSNDMTYVYSFRSICNFLGICPHTIRKVVGVVADQEQEKANHKSLR